MHLNPKPFETYGSNLVVSNIWSWCFLKQLNETLRFKILKILNLHSLLQVCFLTKTKIILLLLLLEQMIPLLDLLVTNI